MLCQSEIKVHFSLGYWSKDDFCICRFNHFQASGLKFPVIYIDSAKKIKNLVDKKSITLIVSGAVIGSHSKLHANKEVLSSMGKSVSPLPNTLSKHKEIIVTALWSLYFYYQAFFGALVFTQKTPNNPKLPNWVKLIDEPILLLLFLGYLLVLQNDFKRKAGKWFCFLGLLTFVISLIVLKGQLNDWSPSMLRFAKNYVFTLLFYSAFLNFVNLKKNRALALFFIPILLSLFLGNVLYLLSSYDLYSNRSIGFYANPNTLGFVSFFIYNFAGCFGVFANRVRILAVISVLLSASISALLMVVSACILELLTEPRGKKQRVLKERASNLIISLVLFLLVIVQCGRVELVNRYSYFGTAIITKVFKMGDGFHLKGGANLSLGSDPTSLAARKAQFYQAINSASKMKLGDLLFGVSQGDFALDFESFHFNWVKHFGIINFLITCWFLFFFPLRVLLSKGSCQLQRYAAIFLVTTFLWGMLINNIYEEAPAYVILAFALVLTLNRFDDVKALV